MKPVKLIKYLLVGLSIVWYIILYHFIERSEFLFFISSILILGLSYFYWIAKNSFGPKEVIVLAILFRALFLLGMPNLSDDYFRFFWDGKLTIEGVNPYEFTPQQYKENGLDSQSQEVYPFLNSQEYFSVYPPVNQFFFKSAAFLAKGNLQGTVFFLKLFIFLFDIAFIFLLMQFLRKLLLPAALAQIYALNPLVIIELTGNLHFEGVMLFFLFSGIFYLWKNRLVFASLAIGLSVGVKIIPLLLLPLFLPFIGIKKSIKLYFGIFFFVFLFSWPFLSSKVILNFSESLNLYFQTFEFNSSVYYLAKQISIEFLGFKSPSIGILLPFFTLLVILALTGYLWVEKPLLRESRIDISLFMKFSAMALAVYYLMSSTVHPWYVINILVFSVISFSRAFVAWSILVFLSYFVYSEYVLDFAPHQDFNSYWLYYIFIFIQYAIVLFIFIFDLSKKHK